MYEIPKDDSIGQVIITKEYIEGIGGPRILLRGQEISLLEEKTDDSMAEIPERAAHI